MRGWARWRTAPLLLAAPLLAGCGPQYAVLDPAGPVGHIEYRLIVLSSAAMAVVIGFVYVLFAYVLVRFRDKPGRRAPYRPDWAGDRRLEVLWFLIPVALLATIAVPTVRETFYLAKLPPARHRLVIDVTAMQWKWLFQYPAQHVATVNYVEIPARTDVLFRLTANGPMNAFWVPRLGGLEYTMPGRVLPLWLEANRPGTYWGHGGQFSGLGFERMFFTVRAVPRARFAAWARAVRRTARPMTMADLKRLLYPAVTGQTAFSAYPSRSFPPVSHGFSLTGGMYTIYARRPPEKLLPNQ